MAVFIIAEPCVAVKDAACVDVCPVDCIYEGADKYYISPDECIECGACEPECPVDAIFDADSVPAQWQNYIGIEKDFFTDREGTEALVKNIMDSLDPTNRPNDRRRADAKH
ncbi:MAG: ferredoxin family protein [Chloroflexi bacterium]|nr:ferredoxin family protein [Chloroflexota bacterium]